jgi:hypothetical protein
VQYGGSTRTSRAAGPPSFARAATPAPALRNSASSDIVDNLRNSSVALASVDIPAGKVGGAATTVGESNYQLMVHKFEFSMAQPSHGKCNDKLHLPLMREHRCNNGRPMGT